MNSHIQLRHHPRVVHTERVLFQTGQRSAGKHIAGPVFINTEWHNYSGVKYYRITIGNPMKHYNWAFSLWIYFSKGSKK